MSSPVESDPDHLRRVLEAIEADAPQTVHEDDPAAIKVLKRLVPHGVRTPLREAVTALQRPGSRRKAQRLVAAGAPVRLNIGSGFAPIAGWTNVDLAGASVDLAWNLKRPIPFPDATVTAIYSEHLYEHLPIAAALSVTRDAVRALRPGGVFRVAVPNAGLLLRSYAGTDDEEWALSRPTRMQAVMSLFYENGHTTMYDEELLTALCTVAGLTSVQARQFGESAIDGPAPDSEHRRSGTLYVEGIRPPHAGGDRHGSR
jgi:predicted SAM-dependent methyltransferase